MSDKDEAISISRADLERMVEEISQRAVDETLTRLGIEAEDVARMQRDFHFLRQLRETHEQVKSRALIVLVGAVVVATITAVALGFKQMLFGGATP